MAAGAPQTVGIPLLLLTAVNLAILGVILWPWQQALSLPVGGTSAIDPAVTLLAYLGLIYWMASGIQDDSRRALFDGAVFGAFGGIALIVRVLLDWRAAAAAYLQPGLLGVAVILWGIANMRGSRGSGNAGMGAMSGVWSAITSGLMGSAAGSPSLSRRPHYHLGRPMEAVSGPGHRKLREQGMVHSLNMATGFLLVGPLVGTIVGLIFAYFQRRPKKLKSKLPALLCLHVSDEPQRSSSARRLRGSCLLRQRAGFRIALKPADQIES